MALPSAYEKYNNSKVMTASPAELTLMLYDGAIKFSNIAIMAIEENNIEKTIVTEELKGSVYEEEKVEQPMMYSAASEEEEREEFRLT